MEYIRQCDRVVLSDIILFDRKNKKYKIGGCKGIFINQCLDYYFGKCGYDKCEQKNRLFLEDSFYDSLGSIG